MESQDFTPSTRSSSSESTSESPSLPEERVRVEESKRSARGSEFLGAGEMEVHWKALNPSSTHCLCTLAWVKPHPMILLHLWDIICMHIVQPASQGLPETPPNHPCGCPKGQQHLPVTAWLQSWRQQGQASGQQAGHSSRNTGDFQLWDWEGNKWVHFYRPSSSAELQRGRAMLMAPGKQEFSRRNRNDSGTAGAGIQWADLQPCCAREPLIYVSV